MLKRARIPKDYRIVHTYYNFKDIDLTKYEIFIYGNDYILFDGKYWHITRKFGDIYLLRMSLFSHGEMYDKLLKFEEKRKNKIVKKFTII